ncbi:MAG: response regulator [Magnetococcales bacterium]|nr:response regulator [Magnetococcales bacterium]
MNNIQAAVERGEREHFDSILTDLQMPILDGLTTTKRIRRDKYLAEAPIIAMTANAMNGDREKGLDASMNDPIAKPVDPDEM